MNSCSFELDFVQFGPPNINKFDNRLTITFLSSFGGAKRVILASISVIFSLD